MSRRATTDLSPEELAVWAVLNRHRGRISAIGLDALSMATGVPERTVQHVVSHLIERHGCAIGSAVTKPMGYFVIETEAELTESVSQLLHRLTALARRIAALKKSAAPLVLNQLAMDLGEAARLGAPVGGRVKMEKPAA
ncbi:MAG: hypothetical protein H8K07_01520 [Nitrospira sp.]|nr:hypothetical protein [Nitrospira sp.]